MDPRKPELVVPRIDELVEQFKKVLTTIKTAKISHAISDAEREGVMVVREICLTAPRLQETLIQASRNRRVAMAHGLVDVEEEQEDIAVAEVEEVEQTESSVGEETEEEPEDEPKDVETVEEVVENNDTTVDEAPVEQIEKKAEEQVEEKPKEEVKEIYVPPNQAETIIVEPNYHKKKKSRRKK